MSPFSCYTLQFIYPHFEQIEGATVGREFVKYAKKRSLIFKTSFLMAGPTRLELATFCVTGRHSNQTELRSHLLGIVAQFGF